MRERTNGSRREVFKREIDEEGEEVYAEMEADRDCFQRKEILQGGETGVRTVAKVFVCVDIVGEEDVFVVAGETWLRSRGGRK